MADDIIDAGISDGEVLVELPELDDAEKVKEEKAKEEFKELQALAQSPAWKETREWFNEKIRKYEKFDYIDFSLGNEAIGEQCKIHKIVAGELKTFISAIDNAIEEGKQPDEFKK